MVEAPERPKDDVGVTPTVIFDLTFRCGDFSGKMMGKFFQSSKISPKVLAYFRGVVFHLSPIVIHQTKSKTNTSYHLKGVLGLVHLVKIY